MPPSGARLPAAAEPRRPPGCGFRLNPRMRNRFMSEAFQSTPNSSSPAAADWGSGRAIRVIAADDRLSLASPARSGVVAFNTYRTVEDRAVMQESVDHLTELRGLVQPVQKHLAPEYSDKDGRLLADPPSDPKESARSRHAGSGPLRGWRRRHSNWSTGTPCKPSLAQATGKKIVLQEYQNSADDVAAVKAGTIQLVALHAADAPYIVNNAGFIPIAVLGSEAGRATATVWTSPCPPTARSERSRIFAGIS